MTDPLPVCLLAGFPGPALVALATRVAGQGPPGQRLALLDIGVGCEIPHVERFAVLGGCACCTAQLPFRTTLVRLLRRGPWDRLLVVASASGHPWQLYERLADLAPHLGLALEPPGVAIDGGSLAPFTASEHPAHQGAKSLLQLARWLYLHETMHETVHEIGTAAVGEVASQARLNLHRAWVAASSWPGTFCGPSEPLWPPVLPALPALPHGRLWCWPPTRIFDRGRVQGLLHRQVGRFGQVSRARSLLNCQAVFRTARGWYHWRWQADPGGGGRLVCEETGWRNDSRLQFVLSAPN